MSWLEVERVAYSLKCMGKPILQALTLQGTFHSCRAGVRTHWAMVRGLSGTGPCRRCWGQRASKASSIFTPAPHRSHPPGLWKNGLPRNCSLLAKKLGNTDTEIKGCRTENNICLVGDLQEHGHLTYKGSRKNKGFLYQEVCNNHHTTNTFTTQETWTLTRGRWFYGTPAHHLLGLPASQIKSLFLAPATHHSFYWPFECSNSYSIAFIVMQRAVQAWTQSQSLYCLTQEAEANHLEKFNYFWNTTEMLILRKRTFLICY